MNGRLSRRDWISAAIAALASPTLAGRALTGQIANRGEREARVGRIVEQYARQGIHRTGTAVDSRSADWLCGKVTMIGLSPALESFPVNRVDPVEAFLMIEGRRIEGLPLFDGAFTGAGGARGSLGTLDAAADIGLAECAPNASAAGPLGDARRANHHKAIVSVTRGARPGLCPSNADLFTTPFGPPVLQVSSEHAPWLNECARRAAQIQVVARVARVATTSSNVTATIPGRDATLPPLVVMTPRSGWYACASERGGGIACWLEVLRAMHALRVARDIVFVASSGHELGHLGINAFVDRRPGIVSRSAGWLHFGANIGAAIEPGTTVQASDDDFEMILSRALTAAEVGIDRRVPRGTVPGGEAEVVHRGGGRYVSVIGRNALFHNPDDRGPHTVNPAAIARFADAFTAITERLVF